MLSRRRFLASSAALAGLASGRLPAAADDSILRRALPATGEHLPAVGLGIWQAFDFAPGSAGYANAGAELTSFLGAHGRVVDSSPLYGRSSETLGELAPAEGEPDGLFIASKIWTRGHQAGRAQLDGECARLRRRCIDLMQVHNLSDVATQLTMLREARAAGRVRLIGLSHYLGSAHEALQRLLVEQPVDVLQINYSIAEPEAENRLFGLARDRGVAIFASRVFAEGALFQKVRGRPVPDFVAELGITSWAQYFLKWILADDRVVVALAGTSRAEHVRDNLAALRGPLPDVALRRRMAEFVRAL